MTRKFATVAAISGAVLLLVAYIVSPYWTVHQIRGAAQEGRGDQLVAYVDFPAVRESIKGQLASAMAARMNAQAKQAPLASLGQALATQVMGGFVDAMVSPEGLSTLIRSGKIPRTPFNTKTTSTNDEPREPRVRQGYAGLNTFEAALVDRESGQDLMSATLSRQGLFSWKLTALNLPALMKPSPKPTP
jgi:hypothetical protein